jgi:hypothetical protein
LARPALTLLAFVFTLFWSAALLFLVEPMVGKMTLPLLGGSPAVWNTCMVFFQSVLLAGYAYAHATTRWLGARRQAALHLAVLFVPLLFFLASGPLTLNRELIADREGNPVLALLLMLTLSAGLPLFVVCASAPLLQKWFAGTGHLAARDPYFLYGASNLGSMVALIGYPVVVEPYLSLAGQRFHWAVGYGVLAALTLVCALLLWQSPALADAPPAGIDPPPSRERPVTWRRRLRWLLLALVPSSLMLSVTTYITTDIAPIPLLWVAPLALYLLSFIVVFARLSPRAESTLVWVGLVCVLAAIDIAAAPRVFRDNAATVWLIRAASVPLLLLSVKVLRLRGSGLIHRTTILLLPFLVLLLVFMWLADISTNIWLSVGLQFALLFIAALVCHGELARDRPPVGWLTEYFLWMSAGGVLGGLFNALVAPLAFTTVVEYPLGLVLVLLALPPPDDGRAARGARLAGLGLAGVWRRRLATAPAADGSEAPAWAGLLDVALPLGLGVLVLGLCWGLPPADETDARLRALAAGLGLSSARVRALLIYALPVLLGLVLVKRSVRLGLGAGTVLLALGLATSQPRAVLIYGLPVALCYAFVRRPLRFGLGAGAVLLAAGLSGLIANPPLFQGRSFFATLSVTEDQTLGPGTRELDQGTTLHGAQVLSPPLRETPLTYYHRSGPIGQVFRAFNTNPGRKVGVFGLGAGTMACYGLPGQQMTFFEIDPVVRAIAFDTDRYFTYVADARKRGVRVDLIFGDARLTLDRQDLPREVDRYGILVVDAFSSDAIPFHLITREALALYLRKVCQDGLICFHISNRYVDLEPVLARLAEDAGLAGAHMSDHDTAPLGKRSTNWVVLARQPRQVDRLLALNEERAAWRKAQERLLPLVACPDPGRGLAGQAALLCGVLGEHMSGRAAEWVRLMTRQELQEEWERKKHDLETSGDESVAAARRHELKKLEKDLKVNVWTDDYSNLLGLLGW